METKADRRVTSRRLSANILNLCCKSNSSLIWLGLSPDILVSWKTPYFVTVLSYQSLRSNSMFFPSQRPMSICIKVLSHYSWHLVVLIQIMTTMEMHSNGYNRMILNSNRWSKHYHLDIVPCLTSYTQHHCGFDNLIFGIPSKGSLIRSRAFSTFLASLYSDSICPFPSSSTVFILVRCFVWAVRRMHF